MAKNILVIPGHGAGDPGASGGGKTEAMMVRQLATEMKAWGGSKARRTAYARDYYADSGILHLDEREYPPSEWRIVELHMDAGGGSARGAHVIQYKSRTGAGKRVAKRVARLLPGRAETHVLRDNLANPKRAYAKGYDYMLVEVGFIDNQHDRSYVAAHMDTIAKAILRGCYITPRATRRKDVKCPW